MNRPGFRGLPIFLLLAACGGGGGGSGTTASTLSGHISIPTLTSAPLERVPLDSVPNDSAASAHLLSGAPEGVLDAERDPIDVLRMIADRTGPYTAQLSSEGIEGEAYLVDLARGEVAPSLDLDAGDVFDVVVHARRGSGSYRVDLGAVPGDRSPRALPETYTDVGDGFVPCEIVAAPRPGYDGARIALETGLVCRGEGAGLCLFRDPSARDEGGLRGLCDVLARCARLEGAGLVRYAEPNALRRLAALPNDPLLPEQWALEQIHALAAWEVTTATGVVIATVDSGIRAHPDLTDNLVAGYDFQDDDADPTDPTQNFSHGTQVAGVIAAVGNNGRGISGVLWSAKVMPVRAFDTAGFGTAYAIANAILYAAGLANASGTFPAEPAAVINLSFASTVFTNSEQDACDQARAAGAFLCAATGNQGSPTIRYPAGYASVVAVGATTRKGERASYSNYGTYIDIVGPGGASGDGVISTGIVAANQYDYPLVNGTSFACPHVAAVAALCLGLAPLTVDEVKATLLSTAQDIETVGVDIETGHGIVDAYRAALSVLGQVPPAYIPYEEIEVRLLRVGTETLVAAVQTSELVGFAWQLPDIPPGRYVLEAGTDRNHDGILSGPGELYGRWDGGNVLVVDGPRNDLDFAITGN